MEFNLRGMEEGIWQVFGDAYRGGVNDVVMTTARF
jgi:hypothetical protein